MTRVYCARRTGVGCACCVQPISDVQLPAAGSCRGDDVAVPPGIPGPFSPVAAITPAPQLDQPMHYARLSPAWSVSTTAINSALAIAAREPR